MLPTKYIEIYWKKVTLPITISPDDLYFNSLSETALTSGDYVTQTKWNNFISLEREDNLFLYPQQKIPIFHGYVHHSLNLQLSFVQNLDNNISLSSLQISQTQIYNIDNIVGNSSILFHYSSSIPLFKPIISNIYDGNKKIGEIEIEIFIQPVSIKIFLLNNPIIIFPFSRDNFHIYYNNLLVKSKQLYVIWTLNNWESHLLKKMQKIRNYWFVSLEKMENCSELECAFTNNNAEWDNQGGKNWLFSTFDWF